MERVDNPRSMMELEATSLMQSPKTLLQNTPRDKAGIGQVIAVDLTGDSIEDREYQKLVLLHFNKPKGSVTDLEKTNIN